MLSPPARRPLRLAVLCSHRAPGLRQLLAAGEAEGFSVVGVVASDPASSALPDTAGRDIPCVVHDIRAFYRSVEAPPGDLSVRLRYDAATARILEPLRPDLLLLAGYIHVLTEPVLEFRPDAIVSVHDSDLTLTGPAGPRYRGLHATRDALLAGERETRSTVHLVTPEVDMGPPLLRSWPFEVPDPVPGESVGSRAWRQREWMMQACWGALLVRSVQLFARREVTLDEGRVLVRGQPGPLTLDRPARLSARPAPRATQPQR